MKKYLLLLVFISVFFCFLAGVAEAKDKYKRRTIKELVRQFAKGNEKARDTLLRIGKPAVPALIKILKMNRENHGVRWCAAELLGLIKDERAIPALAKIMHERTDALRLKSVFALGQIGKPAAKILIKESQRTDRSGQRFLISALGKSEDKAAVKPLVIILLSNSLPECRLAAYALGALKAKEAVPALLKATRQERWLDPLLKDYEKEYKRKLNPKQLEYIKKNINTVRCSAIWALGVIGDLSAMPALKKLLKDNNNDVSAFAAQALGTIGKKAVPTLIAFLNDEDARIRMQAAQQLGRIRDKVAVPALIKALKDDSIQVRCVAAYSLGEIADKSAASALIKMIPAKDENINASVSKALWRIGDKAAVPVLVKTMKQCKNLDVALALGWFGHEDAVPVLLKGLRVRIGRGLCKDYAGITRRMKVFPVLRKIDINKVVPKLLDMLDDKDKGLSGGAAYGLRVLTRNHNFGADAAKWREWWKKQKKK